MSLRFVYVVVALVVLVVPGISQAAVATSYTDLWDISQGTVLDATSGPLNYRPSYRFYVEDMFGAATPTSLAPGITLFKDYMYPGYSGGSVPAGYIHYVEWHTPSVVTLRSFALHSYIERWDRRAFNRFTLSSSSTAGGPWINIHDTGTTAFAQGYLDIEMDVTPVNAQYFRAEFVQAWWSDPAAVGPRAFELDGFDTFLDGSTGAVPEPASLAIWSVLALVGAGVGWRRRRKSA
jgi:hypothetical protein